MRILMFHPHDLRRHPWTIRMIALAGALVRRGHTVTVCWVPDKWANLKQPPLRELPDDGVRYVELAGRDRNILSNFSTAFRFGRDAEVIHIQKCFPSVVLPALWTAFLHRLPVHYDWDDNETQILKHARFKWSLIAQTAVLERLLPRFADTVSVASERLRERAIACGVAADRIVPAPVGADLGLFHPRHTGASVRAQTRYNIGERQLVLYLGQLEGAAYVDTFLRSVQQAAPRFPSVVWAVVGGGRQLRSLKLMARTLGIADQVLFTGYVTSDKAAAWIAAANVCVATLEDHEAARCKSPLKIAEYMAAGKAVVASDVGEAPRMLAGCGLIVPPQDPHALADAIARYLHAPDLACTHGQRARQRAEQTYNWETTATNLENAYRMACQLDG